MAVYNDGKIIYSLNVSDVQQVVDDVLDRKLTPKEIDLIEKSIGDYINWFQAIEESINKVVGEK